MQLKYEVVNRDYNALGRMQKSKQQQKQNEQPTGYIKRQIQSFNIVSENTIMNTKPRKKQRTHTFEDTRSFQIDIDV